MRNLTVSDIYCLTSQSHGDNPPDSQEQLYSVKGNASSRLMRRRDYQNSDVFPPGCMGNSRFVDLAALDRGAKKRERLSYDEQERAMNILAKIHRSRKASRLKLESNRQVDNIKGNSGTISEECRRDECRRKFRLTVRKSQPDFADFEHLVEKIRHKDELAMDAGRGDDGDTLSSVELRFMSGIIAKEDALEFFTDRLRGNSSPSLMNRNPITGNGVEDNSRHERKRGFESVIKFMESEREPAKRTKSEGHI